MNLRLGSRRHSTIIRRIVADATRGGGIISRELVVRIRTKRKEKFSKFRKRQQEQHPDLTITGIYNVLEKLRSGEPLTAKERSVMSVRDRRKRMKKRLRSLPTAATVKDTPLQGFANEMLVAASL